MYTPDYDIRYSNMDSYKKKKITKLEVTQYATGRFIIGITLQDKKTKKSARHRTRVTDAVTRATRLKWDYAGHIARVQDNR